MAEHPFRRLEFTPLPPEVTLNRARDFFEEMNDRQTTRHVATTPVPRKGD